MRFDSLCYLCAHWSKSGRLAGFFFLRDSVSELVESAEPSSSSLAVPFASSVDKVTIEQVPFGLSSLLAISRNWSGKPWSVEVECHVSIMHESVRSRCTLDHRPECILLQGDG